MNAPKEKRGEKWFNVGVGRLAARMRAVANCGKQTCHLSCSCHGPKGSSSKPCDDELMSPYCANRGRRARVQWFKDHWPERIYVLEFPVPQGERSDNEQREALRATKKAVVKHLRDVAGKGAPLGLTVEGTDRVLMLYPSIEYKALIEQVWPDQRSISRLEAASRAAYAYYQAHEHFVRRFFGEKPLPLLDVMKYPWHSRSWLKRVTCSREVGVLLPWTSIPKLRAEANEKWKKEHPGLQRGQCDHVVGKADICDDPVFCGQTLAHEWVYDRTGSVFLKKYGGSTDRERDKALHFSGNEERFIQRYHEKLFAFSAPP